MCPFPHHSPLFHLSPMIPYIRFFKVISILKNFLQFFISEYFSAMINTAYLSFLKILSSMTANPSNFLSTFLITPSFSLLGPIPWDFFFLSVASTYLSLEIFFLSLFLAFLDLKSFS